MTPVSEALLATPVGVGLAADIIALVLLTAWSAERRADQDVAEVPGDAQPPEVVQPWNTV